MTYTETAPSEDFKELVHSYWKFEICSDFNNGNPFSHEVMPENTLSIVFVNLPHFKGATCLGVQGKRMTRQIFPGSVYLGIRFNPWICIDTLFKDKLQSANQITKLPSYVLDFFAEIDPYNVSAGFSDFHLIEKGLSRLTKSHKVFSDPLVKYICLRLDGEVKINDLVKEIPLSVRPVQKHFKLIAGITMSEYKNISRLRNTVKLIYTRERNITHAAFENGYTDHAHFINNFKKYMLGTSVRSFLARTEAIKHSFRN